MSKTDPLGGSLGTKPPILALSVRLIKRSTSGGCSVAHGSEMPFDLGLGVFGSGDFGEASEHEVWLDYGPFEVFSSGGAREDEDRVQVGPFGTSDVRGKVIADDCDALALGERLARSRRRMARAYR